MTKRITKKQMTILLEGANLLGTGGGGTIAMGLPIIKKIKGKVTLCEFSDLKESDIVCTVFGVGGKKNADPIKAIQNSVICFQQVYKKNIKAIIPVEIGPESLATAMLVSSVLDIPLLDSDIVGMRSSPEIFLETISLGELKRTPCSIADDKGNSAILYDTTSFQQTENFLRNFAISSGGDGFVTGYPNTVKALKGIVATKSISSTLQIGKDLATLRKKKISFEKFCQKNNLIILGAGKITSQTNNTKNGFSEGFYEIDNGIYRILYKNENLVVLKNKKTLITCPDSIILINTNSGQAVNNFNKNLNQRVVILGKKAIPIWRTKKGKKLFSPQNLGLLYKQVLLK